MSASTACPAVCSCQNPSAPLAAMITRMINPSARSPSAIARIVAATRINTIGLVNCASSSRSPRRAWATSTVLGPSRASRRAASSGGRPAALVPVAPSSSSRGTDQNARGPSSRVACAGDPTELTPQLLRSSRSCRPP
jgi:hypothetical protein